MDKIFSCSAIAGRALLHPPLCLYIISSDLKMCDQRKQHSDEPLGYSPYDEDLDLGYDSDGLPMGGFANMTWPAIDPALPDPPSTPDTTTAGPAMPQQTRSVTAPSPYVSTGDFINPTLLTRTTDEALKVHTRSHSTSPQPSTDTTLSPSVLGGTVLTSAIRPLSSSDLGAQASSTCQRNDDIAISGSTQDPSRPLPLWAAHLAPLPETHPDVVTANLQRVRYGSKFPSDSSAQASTQSNRSSRKAGTSLAGMTFNFQLPSLPDPLLSPHTPQRTNTVATEPRRRLPYPGCVRKTATAKAKADNSGSVCPVGGEEEDMATSIMKVLWEHSWATYQGQERRVDNWRTSVLTQIDRMRKGSTHTDGIPTSQSILAELLYKYGDTKTDELRARSTRIPQATGSSTSFHVEEALARQDLEETEYRISRAGEIWSDDPPPWMAKVRFSTRQRIEVKAREAADVEWRGELQRMLTKGKAAKQIQKKSFAARKSAFIAESTKKAREDIQAGEGETDEL